MPVIIIGHHIIPIHSVRSIATCARKTALVLYLQREKIDKGNIIPIPLFNDFLFEQQGHAQKSDYSEQMRSVYWGNNYNQHNYTITRASDHIFAALTGHQSNAIAIQWQSNHYLIIVIFLDLRTASWKRPTKRKSKLRFIGGDFQIFTNMSFHSYWH